MAINEEDLERLRASLVLSDVVQQYVALRRVGRNWVGLCPFHAEKSGSFNVRDETGRYKCFGCDAAGDVFKFVQEIEHVDFVTAVESLANKAGIELRYTTGEAGDRVRQKRRQLVEAMGKAVEWYHQRLLEARMRVPLATTCASAAWPATWRARSRSAGHPTTGMRCAAT
jgi:DNA primase